MNGVSSVMNGVSVALNGTKWFAGIVAAVATVACAVAQPMYGDQASAPVAPQPDPHSPAAVIDRMTGVWERTAANDPVQTERVPAREQLGICPIVVEGLAHAMYVEHAAGTLGPDPASQRVMSLYLAPDGVRLRLWNFRHEPRADVLAGMWALPEAFPSIGRDELFPVADLVLTPSDDGGVSFMSPGHWPTDRDGAVAYEASLSIEHTEPASAGLIFRELGYAADGKTVFDTTPAPWTKVDSPAVVNRLDDGVITIDYHSPDGVPAFDSNIMFLKYVMHIGDGTKTDDTERHGGIFRESLPVRDGKFLGWKLGLPGMTEGGRRLIIMPPGTGAMGDTETLYARINLVQLEQDVPGQTVPDQSIPGTASPDQTIPDQP